MKPRTLETQARIQQSQEKALEAILLAREKDGREFGYQTFGGPILVESDTLQRYDEMLQGLIGKH